MSTPPAQVVVASIPAGPIVISVPADIVLDPNAHGRRVLESDRAQVVVGIRIVDTRAAGSMPWVMSVQASAESIIVTVG